jgi:hypothetical protein
LVSFKIFLAVPNSLRSTADLEIFSGRNCAFSFHVSGAEKSLNPYKFIRE